ncbi:hypothetical protein SAMN02910291_01272 [Desulfovibrio desulfuricans]|uniref:Uncharacterized protein n=1 Tax=Desulfovibrio desulfuricans TaxID=876 RepID=A0AA94HT57_DESDE|nr:hypothetical protein SAMN02910291_01272 [Desulfovibrio desulfuricans]SPD35233.1 Hypothetical protein DSVG11_1128 [Desulfovibrio sp. G11]
MSKITASYFPPYGFPGHGDSSPPPPQRDCTKGEKPPALLSTQLALTQNSAWRNMVSLISYPDHPLAR